jgi:tetratricopeptide (TPR) repeat protein
MDFSAAPSGAAEAPVEVAPPEGLLLSEPISEVSPESADRVGSVPGLEQAAELELEVTELENDLGLERTESEELEFIGEPLEGMDEPAAELADDVALLDTTADDLIVSPPGASIDAGDAEIGGDLELMEPELAEVEVTASTGPLGDLPMLPVEPAGAPSVVELESQILDDPDDPDLHLQLADRLVAGGEEVRGVEELELALSGYERLSDWPRATEMAERLTTLAPDVIRHHQKRVELAFRSGERTPLLDAYLALGDALARAGATEKAMAVFGRVEEHDPGNAHATAALAVLRGEARQSGGQPAAPAGPAAPARPGSEARPAKASPTAPPVSPRAASSAGSFVDLGSMILEEGGPRDTRMRIERADPKDQDEQKEFHEILEQFKRGIDENLDSEDYEAHYDLGVAFKEMGLLDEAIAEFQKALRSPEGRLRTSEALGICFYDKGQFGISETVLRRAVETVDGGDEAKIGLLYWLGRAAEAQGKEMEAITSYERALAVDIRFMDLSDRMHRLSADRRE